MLQNYYKDLEYLKTRGYKVIEDNCTTEYEEFTVIMKDLNGFKKTFTYIFDYETETYLEKEDYYELYPVENENEEDEEWYKKDRWNPWGLERECFPHL